MSLFSKDFQTFPKPPSGKIAEKFGHVAGDSCERKNKKGRRISSLLPALFRPFIDA